MYNNAAVQPPLNLRLLKKRYKTNYLFDGAIIHKGAGAMYKNKNKGVGYLYKGCSTKPQTRKTISGKKERQRANNCQKSNTIINKNYRYCNINIEPSPHYIYIINSYAILYKSCGLCINAVFWESQADPKHDGWDQVPPNRGLIPNVSACAHGIFWICTHELSGTSKTFKKKIYFNEKHNNIHILKSFSAIMFQLFFCLQKYLDIVDTLHPIENAHKWCLQILENS